MKVDPLSIEHDAVVDVAIEDECYTDGRPYIEYIEGHYVAEYTPKIFENLRFYKRKKGKQVGKYTAIYVNPKTGKAMRNPTSRYLAEIEKKLDDVYIPMKRSDLQAVRHMKEHIKARILENQRKTLAKLKKEKENA